MKNLTNPFHRKYLAFFPNNLEIVRSFQGDIYQVYGFPSGLSDGGIILNPSCDSFPLHIKVDDMILDLHVNTFNDGVDNSK